MTEADWVNGNQLQAMVEHLDPFRYDRKLRLFAAACCRTAWPRLFAPEFRDLVEASEDFADGKISALYLRQVYDAISEHTLAPEYTAVEVGVALNCASWHASAARYLQCAVLLANCHVSGEDRARGDVHVRWAVERNLRSFADLLRDVVGNPFRPVAFDPRWRTADTVGIARAVYEDRVFSRLPLLADALMDAGCDDEQVISHCRHSGPHVRGCWVVDLVLGKE
jgi:hypothetical protein